MNYLILFIAISIFVLLGSNETIGTRIQHDGASIVSAFVFIATVCFMLRTKIFEFVIRKTDNNKITRFFIRFLDNEDIQKYLALNDKRLIKVLYENDDLSAITKEVLNSVYYSKTGENIKVSQDVFSFDNKLTNIDFSLLISEVYKTLQNCQEQPDVYISTFSLTATLSSANIQLSNDYVNDIFHTKYNNIEVQQDNVNTLKKIESKNSIPSTSSLLNDDSNIIEILSENYSNRLTYWLSVQTDLSTKKILECIRLADYYTSKECLTILMEYPVDINGNTLLHYAVIEDNSNVVEILIENNYQNTKNNDGKSALDIAIDRKHKKNYLLLMSSEYN